MKPMPSLLHVVIILLTINNHRMVTSLSCFLFAICEQMDEAVHLSVIREDAHGMRTCLAIVHIEWRKVFSGHPISNTTRPPLKHAIHLKHKE
jgi:hypothetical protein